MLSTLEPNTSHVSAIISPIWFSILLSLSRSLYAFALVKRESEREREREREHLCAKEIKEIVEFPSMSEQQTSKAFTSKCLTIGRVPRSHF